jgi:1-deoxy-D-xylulose-5-phosphate reductoisomerase|tara:strand:- start:350 stop:1543 length:1194 start_codon:yes stop_codon:yes gene_type:complete
MAKKRVLLLGSTGSIGENTDRVVQNLAEELELVGLAAHSSWERLLEQIASHHPEAVALVDQEAAGKLRAALENADDKAGALPRIYEGEEGLVELVRETEADVLVAAISGAAGLPANIAALETGKDLALANKESLVMSGSILTRLARKNDRRILPVDSEHSAIFQSLEAGSREEVERVILTASGGPFRQTSAEELEKVTRQDALNHPTWEMGEKITIDSATLMNKALEIIEARWLFDLPPEQIEVVVHPQSIIHSLVEYRDGSTICQLGPPDMRVPIQYALTYPRRLPLPTEQLSLAKLGQLTFESPDTGRFPALRLAYEVLEQGGTAATVFNAANEVAVAAFLKEEIPFLGILKVVETCLKQHNVVENPDLENIFAADEWARLETEKILKLECKESS